MVTTIRRPSNTAFEEVRNYFAKILRLVPQRVGLWLGGDAIDGALTLEAVSTRDVAAIEIRVMERERAGE